MSALSARITIEPGKRSGEPCIRGLRITVWDVLGWLGASMTEQEILDEHPDLEKDDFPAVYQYAAEAGRNANSGEAAVHENLVPRLLPWLLSLLGFPAQICDVGLQRSGHFGLLNRFV